MCIRDSIVDVKEASPAEAAGIQAGDLIVKVNEEDILTIGYTQAMSNIKGEEGTKVNLTLRREGEDYSVELTRKNIQSSTIEYRPLGENGYIKISNFDDTTAVSYTHLDVYKRQIFGRKSILRSLLAVVVGAVIYRFVLTIALRIGLEAGDLKLFSAILVTIAICIPTLKGFIMKRRSRRAKN